MDHRFKIEGIRLIASTAARLDAARCSNASCWLSSGHDVSVAAMVGPWPFKPYTFRALAKTLGRMWVRCDVCRRYAPLHISPKLRDVDYRTETFSCSRCGSDAAVCVVEPIKETGMEDYRLDEVDRPEHHPAAIERLSGRRSGSRVDWSAGELPGRKVDGRR